MRHEISMEQMMNPQRKAGEWVTVPGRIRQVLAEEPPFYLIDFGSQRPDDAPVALFVGNVDNPRPDQVEAAHNHSQLKLGAVGSGGHRRPLPAARFEASREMLKLMRVGMTYLSFRQHMLGMSQVVAIKRPWPWQRFGAYWSTWDPTVSCVVERQEAGT